VKQTLKYVAVAVGMPIALIFAIIIWKANFFLLPFATIEENGHTASGYVYSNSYQPKRITHLVITRRENGQQHSHLVWIENDPHHGAPMVLDCKEWTVAYLPLFMFPDGNPPCVKWYAEGEVPQSTRTPKRDVKVKERSVEFTANDGRRVDVQW
jgi:hypothetical protein